jgi:hypothetical protein
MGFLAMILPARSDTVRALFFVGAAVLLGVLALAARGTKEGALAPGDDPRARQQKLDAEMQAALRRKARKARVVRALLAGRLRLTEAAAYFRALNQGTHFDWVQFRESFPGATDEERHCHQVISFAFAAASDHDPRRAEEVRSGLLAELGEHLRRGPLRLPDLPGPLGSLDDLDRSTAPGQPIRARAQ